MIVDKIALILVIVGALNWGGVGLFGFDTVAFLFGGQAARPLPDRLRAGRAGRSLVRHAAVPGHGGQHRPRASHSLSHSTKKEHLTVLFFPCYFPACRRFTKSSAGVTLTVR